MGVAPDLRSCVWSLQVGACPWGDEVPDGDRSRRRTSRHRPPAPAPCCSRGGAGAGVVGLGEFSLLFKPSSGNLGIFALPLPASVQQSSSARAPVPKRSDGLLGADFLTWWRKKAFELLPVMLSPSVLPSLPSQEPVRTGCRRGWCLHGRGGDSSLGKPFSEGFERPRGWRWRGLSRLWGSPYQTMPGSRPWWGWSRRRGAVVIPLMYQEGFLRVP